MPWAVVIDRAGRIVLTVHEPGRDARSYRLPPDRAVDSGPDAAVNTLA